MAVLRLQHRICTTVQHGMVGYHNVLSTIPCSAVQYSTVLTWLNKAVVIPAIEIEDSCPLVGTKEGVVDV